MNYRIHNCGVNHREWPTVARCQFPKAALIAGNGQHALVSHCGPQTVTLYEDPHIPAMYAHTRCGAPRCHYKHEALTIHRGILQA